MQIRIQINKSLNYTIDLNEHGKDISIGRHFYKQMSLHYTILGRSSTGHFKFNEEITSVPLREILTTLVNGHNDEILKNEKLLKEFKFLEKLIQKQFHYFY